MQLGHRSCEEVNDPGGTRTLVAVRGGRRPSSRSAAVNKTGSDRDVAPVDPASGASGYSWQSPLLELRRSRLLRSVVRLRRPSLPHQGLMSHWGTRPSSGRTDKSHRKRTHRCADRGSGTLKGLSTLEGSGRWGNGTGRRGRGCQRLRAERSSTPGPDARRSRQSSALFAAMPMLHRG